MKEWILRVLLYTLVATAGGLQLRLPAGRFESVIKRATSAGKNEDAVPQHRDVSFLKIVSAKEYSDTYPNPISESSTGDMSSEEFGDIFQQCAPYIAMHRGTTMVIHIPDHCIGNKPVFEALLDDISILHLLGVQLCLVVGVRAQLNAKLIAAGREPVFHTGIRVTDTETMRCLMEVSGAARFEIESVLARGFRGRPGQSGINVVSGNFLYSAKPLGVRDGVDYMLTGEVRRIEAENINRRLLAGDICLLTSLGHSPSGEVFNVPSEFLAAG